MINLKCDPRPKKREPRTVSATKILGIAETDFDTLGRVYADGTEHT